MFDMLLESGHRPSLPSWGKGVAVTLHVVVVAALWRAPASPAPVSFIIPTSLPSVDPSPSRRDDGPMVPRIICDCVPPVLPPPEIPQDIFKTLSTPGINVSGPTHSFGGPTLEPDNSVYPPSLVQEAPELLSAPVPVYPPLLRSAGVQGRVMVAAVVDTLGQPENGSVRIVRSDNPGFEAAALATVRAARFRPARIYGRAVRVLVHVPVVFQIN